MQAISARFIEDLRDALAEHEVRYLFIGKGAAIIQGFVDTTQDADVIASKQSANREKDRESLPRLKDFRRYLARENRTPGTPLPAAGLPAPPGRGDGKAPGASKNNGGA